MSDSVPLGNDHLVDPSVPLESILCTDELRHRASRLPASEIENRALVELARALVDSKTNILQILAEKILAVARCDSAGLSLLTKDDGGERFYWPAITGEWKSHTGGATPRDCGPSGDALDRNCALLFRHLERRYIAFQPVMPAAEECLIVPFYVDGTAVATMWVVMHSDRRKFDAEDERIMSALGQFAAVAYQTLESLHDLKVQVAAREEAEKALRRLATGAEQQARSMIDAALDAVVAMNVEGIITNWNQQAEQIFGWKKDEALGRRLSETIIPENYRPAHEKGLRHFLETGEGAVLNRRIEMTALRRNGQVFPVELTVIALRVSESWSFQAFLPDITDLKTAGAALLASERSLRSIIDTIPTLAWSAEADGFVDFPNRRRLEFTGLSAEQAHGFGWSVAIHPADAKGLLEYLQARWPRARRWMPKRGCAASTANIAGSFFAPAPSATSTAISSNGMQPTSTSRIANRRMRP